jgi:uncharacterized protein (DUF488 family)
MNIYTIGFTKKSAETFFTTLQRSGAQRLVDVRLNNVSQLAGFAKRDDLRFFTRSLCNMDYLHTPELAPTAEMLDAYKKEKGEWSVYEDRFLGLMRDRKIEETIAPELIDGACLLCSEEKPHHCHRRLVAEYLSRHWPGVNIIHLG